MKDSKDRELISHKGIPGYFVPRSLYELMEFGIESALADIDSKGTKIKDLTEEIERLTNAIREIHPKWNTMD